MTRFHIIIIVFAFMLIGQKAFGESVTKTVHFSHSELIIDTIADRDSQVYCILSYPGTEKDYYNLGKPLLPAKFITIPIPYTADDITLSIKQYNISSYNIDKRIFPAQGQEKTSIEKAENGFIHCDKYIYESIAPYPSGHARIEEISCAGYGDRIVVIAVYPIIYWPSENRYEFAEDMELAVTYKHSSKRTQTLTYGSRTTDIGIPFYEYCVITSRNLKDAFTRLVSWKREKGLNAGVICKEDILNNPNIVGDTVSAIYDDAGKIRQYLQYAYASGVTKYVLFGGNYQVLPIRYGTGSNNFWTDSEPDDYKIPSDFYFSELNSNWNKDNDIYYGESDDKLDYGSELYVGRILCTKPEEIRNYTDKLLRYEMNPGNGSFSYLKKALYTQSDQMQAGYEQDSIAAHLRCVFPIDTIMSENPSEYDEAPISPLGNEVIAEMNNRYGYVSWGGHGGPYTVTVKSRKYNHSPRYAISSVQASTTQITYITQESANGLDNLTNKDYPMFAYSISCSITPFDIYNNYSELPNIGQSFTLGKDYGGPVLVGNTRYGWCGSSAGMQMKFNECLIVNPMVGYAQNYAKMNYHNHYLRHSSNIIGCPNIRVWTDVPRFFGATMCYDYNNCVISANNSITDAEIAVRDLTQSDEIIENYSFNPSQGPKTLINIENSLITLTGKNCLPQIMPLTIQNATLEGTHYAIVKDVSCGKNVRSGAQGSVTFDEGSDYTFETKGTFKLTKGVKIKKGARLKVVSSEINY